MGGFFSSKDETKQKSAGTSRATFDDPRAQGLIDQLTKSSGQSYKPDAQTNYLQSLGTNQLVQSLNTPAKTVDVTGRLNAIRAASDAQTPLDVANTRSKFYNKPTGRNDIAVADTVARNAANRDNQLYQTEMEGQQFNANAENARTQQIASLGQALSSYLDPNQQQQIATNNSNNSTALQLLSLLRGEDTSMNSTSTTRSRAPGSQLAGQAIGAIASGVAMCWVARAVYGAENPTWLVFRDWMVTEAPAWLRGLYLKHGERFAEEVEKDEELKKRVKARMDSILLDRFKIIRN